jgi:ABC-type dipeptide/oligopeptide/nickel transport system permease subunit
MSATDLSTRVAALDDASAQQLADRILAGGRASLVISTTAIIIILLILILLTS